MALETLFLSTILLYILYRWLIKNADFFAKRGIPYDKTFPIFGSFINFTLRRRSLFDATIDIYNKHKGRVYGIFFQMTPMYLIRDPEIIRQITVKNFDNFVNHPDMFGDEQQDLFANSLLQLKNAKWKDMRSTLSPAFTGSKLRQMFQLINQVADESVKYLQKLQSEGNNDGLELELKDYATRFTIDVIASTAFGLQVNSFKEQDNPFYMLGKKATTPNWRLNLRFLLFFNFRSLAKLLRMELFEKSITTYFRRLVIDALKYRKENNIRRPDMINMLMEARGLFPTEMTKSHNREWTDTEMAAQCFIFFFAGFETVSTLICFAAHELMENPEVQEKLFQEVDEVNKQLEGKQLTYEALQGMKYLDMVVNETLRKWPGAISLDRECTQDFVCETDGKRIVIKKGEAIMIPVVGLQRDPQYYPNPIKFDPERFSDENKAKIKPFTYIPFGEGPRNCIGSRFALLEGKAILYYLIRNFRIAAAKNSMVPIKLRAYGFNIMPEAGFWLKLIARNKI